MAQQAEPALAIFRRAAQLQAKYAVAAPEDRTRTPEAALESLRQALEQAPRTYRQYLSEALACYEHHLYRGAILMVWASVVDHLYTIIAAHRGGIRKFEQANRARFGTSNNYRQIRKRDDLLYLRDRDFLQLGEDAGLYNRNARLLLIERLDLRNRCGHPTQYQPGREETVIFIESLALNILTGHQLNWSS